MQKETTAAAKWYRSPKIIKTCIDPMAHEEITAATKVSKPPKVINSFIDLFDAGRDHCSNKTGREEVSPTGGMATQGELGLKVTVLWTWKSK